MARSRKKRSKPMTLLQFETRFATDKACAEFFFKQRWPNGWECPKCGHKKAYYIAKRGLWECAACRRQTSVTAGTLLHGTRTPLRLWFLAMLLMVSDKRGISSVSLGQRLGVKQATAWCVLQKLRRAMEEQECGFRLDGSVVLSECYFGAPKDGGGRKRATSKTPVLAALSQTGAGGPAFLRMTVLGRLDRAHVKAAVEASIRRGSSVLSDRLRGFHSLSAWGYNHERIPAAKADTSSIRGWSQIIISNARALISGTYHGVSEKHLQSYLSEYGYRFNRRSHLEFIFHSIVTDAARSSAWTYADIVGKAQATPAIS